MIDAIHELYQNVAVVSGLGREATAYDIDGNVVNIDFDAIEAHIAKNSYIAQRQAAYPPLSEFADAHVKMQSTDPIIQSAGAAQLAAYYNDCWAVKNAIPKS